MKQPIRVIASFFLLLAFCFFSVSVCVAEKPELLTLEIVQEIPAKEGKTSNEAAAMFIDRIMSGEAETGGMRGSAGYAALGEREKRLYNQLKSLIAAIANGQSSSTQLAIPLSEVFEKDTFLYDEVEKGASDLPQGWFTRLIDIPMVVDALLVDCPYELYWFNKTKGYSYGLTNGYYQHYPDDDHFQLADYDTDGAVSIKMYVGTEYALNGNLLACDPSWGTAANRAAVTARSIVTENAALGDVAKLTAYKTEICSLTDYNDAAAAGGVSYGNPWQMIWVFDGDDSTTVVCEGYSKAFQFLCDESVFQSSQVKSIIASGVMSAGTGAGRHMWNIVTLADGRKYLADITNSDTGTVGSGGDLFLTRCSETREYTFDEESYDAFVFPAGGMEILYGYDEDIISLYGSSELDVLDVPVRQVTISFEPGSGGTGEMESITVSAGEPFPVPTCGFAHENGTFVHWVSGSQIITGETMTADNDMMLTAIWKTGSYAMTVVLKYYDTTQSTWKSHVTSPLYYGDPYTFPESIGVLPENYVFQYWQGALAAYQPGDYFTVDNSYIFSEVWFRFPDSGVIWSVSDSGILSISGQGTFSCEGSDGAYGGIFMPWIAEKDRISSVIIEEDITTIGSYAFYDMDIETVGLPDSLIAIGTEAFANCSSLSDISFPSNLKTVGDSAFLNCINLCSNTINLTDTALTVIGKSAFYGCNPSSLWLPVTLEEIGETMADQTGGCQIHYMGSPSQWAAITIHPNNPVILSPSSPILYALPDADSFSLSPNPLTLSVGNTYALQLSDISPANGVCLPVWASSDEMVATVDEIGCVTAIKSGTAEITAYFNGFTAATSVIVPCVHQLEMYEGESPTCTESGIAEYWECTLCGKLFCDENAETEIQAPVELAALGHNLVRHDAKNPTCNEVGWDDYDTCTRCDFTTYMEKAALGHNWSEPMYTWSENSMKITAVRVCTRDESHLETETADVTAEVTKAAACEVPGETTYTSDEFENAAFTVQTKTLADIPALGHDLVHHEAKDPTCTDIGWDEYDTCTRCDYTTYAEKAAMGHELVHHEAKALTCTDIGWDDYDTCARCDYTTYAEKAAPGHDLVHHDAQAPTCTEIGWAEYDTCTRCDYTTYAEKAALGHDWGEPAYTWSENSMKVTAVRICAHDESHLETETADATAEITKAATCEVPGETTYTSDEFENAAFTVQTKTLADIPAMGHELAHHEAKAPTCTDIGWDEYDTCTRCDYTTYAEKAALGHDLVHHEAKAPTCTDIGWDAYNTCSRCNYTTYAEKTALGHDWGEPEYTWSGNSMKVTAARACTRDENHTETETADVTAEITKAATCESSGETTYTSDEFTNTAFAVQTKTLADIPALGHDWDEPSYAWIEDFSKVMATRVCRRDASHIEAEEAETTFEVTMAATCESNGVTTYTCAGFENPAFSVQPLTIDNIPALGHNWGEPTYKWNSDNSSVTAERICARDSSHTETETVDTTAEVTKEATFEEKGETTYTATFSNPGFAVQQKTEANIPQLDYDWSSPSYTWNEDFSKVTATRYSRTDASIEQTETVGTVSEVTKAATCEENGETVYTSEAFENTAFSVQIKVVENIPALGHDWSEPEYTWSANSMKVTAIRVCSRDENHRETETADVTAEVTKAATCEVSGETTYTCDEFENAAFAVQTKTVADIPALGHDLVHHEAQAPTCTETGWDEYDTCTRCDYTTYAEKAALGHDLVHHEVQAPTCTEAGWDEYDTCTRCDYTTYTEKAALGHDLVHHEAKDPTCTEAGWNAYDACSRCDYTTYTEKAALGHEWGEPEYTWSENSFRVTATRVCAHDESHRETETADVTAEVTKAAVCEVPGETTYTSDEFENAAFTVQTKTLADIPALGHALVHHEAHAPTCTENGWDEYDTCTRCDYTTYAEKAALGHDLVHNEAKAPTCTEVGWDEYGTCTRCDYTTYAEKAALGHNLVHHEAKAPTCTEVGWDEYDTCSRCDYTTYTEKAALGHEWGEPEYTWSANSFRVTATRVCAHDESHLETETADVTAEVTKAATCEVPGETTYTSDEFTNAAFAVQSKILTDIPALGHDLVHHKAKAPTCTEAGWDEYDTCARCEYTTYTEKAALGHDLVHHEAKASTCTETGWEEYDTCSRCDYTTYAEKAALGHDLVHREANDPTCTEIGWDEYDTCSRCDYTTYAEIPAIGHEWEKAEYEWSADKTTVTATRACKHDCSHTETETVDVTAVILSPTEETAGSAEYTSGEFAGEGFSVQARSIDIPALKDLSVIRLPEMLSEIEEEAFANLACQAIIIPDGCTAIGEYAFAGCADLLYIRIPASAASIPGNAFEGCNVNLVIDRVQE